jgi:hypothetical protein
MSSTGYDESQLESKGSQFWAMYLTTLVSILLDKLLLGESGR